jgi:hypothetical protein
MSIEYRQIEYHKVIKEKCPECRTIGERHIRRIGNNKYLYYYHRVKGKLNTCYLGKMD